MKKTQSLLPVPNKGERKPPKKLFFGQLLVETKAPRLDFAKEIANAILIQAEMNGAALDYSPNGLQFVTRKEGNEHILEFEGDLPAYLKLPEEEACSLHVSFREAEEGDKNRTVIEKANLTPSYVLTLSVEASEGGEFEDEGFWGQLGNNLFCGLSEPYPKMERAGDQNMKIAVVFGSEEGYTTVPNKISDKG